MMPDRIEKQVAFFQLLDDRVGVVFTDATYVDAAGIPFRKHFDYLRKKKLVDQIPNGDVFRDVLTRYFICSPTMMIRRNVMESLQGYDETLSYEDFDFWVRASREFHFAFLNESLTKVRKSSGSMSTGWYMQGDPQLYSTYIVCEKAVKLCRSRDDEKALKWRVFYEYRQSVFSNNRGEARLFAQLLKSLGGIPLSFYVIQLAARLPFPWPWLRKKYYELAYS
jgi:hypothetical protein